jgi:hypothetical protein
MEHILKIKLQFEELGSEATSNLDTASEQVSDTLKKGYERAAKGGGEAMIQGMTDLKKAWEEFDWSHPIQSMKNLFSGAIDWLKNRFGIIGGIIAGVLGLFIAGWKAIAKGQSDVLKAFSMLRTDLTYFDQELQEFVSYGETIGDKVGRALREVAEVSQITGEAMGDVAARFAQIAQARVPIQDVQALTKASFLGAKALGANVDEMTEMVSQLSVMGRLTATEIAGPTGIIQTFSSVQDAVGLTEKEMAGLIETTTQLTRQMGALGASGEAITAIATAAAKLTGLFGQLGLGAERAGEILNKVFDPSMLGENAYLVRQMGFSMNEYLDMLAGGEVDQRKLTEGLITASKEIMNMQSQGASIVAMNQRAQMMGFRNASEALRLAKEGPAILADMDEAIRRGDVEYAQRAAEGMAELSGVLERLKNRFMAFFGRLAAPLIGKFTDVVAALEARFVANEKVIGQFFDKMVEGIITFIENFDINKVIGAFQTFMGVLRGLAKHMKIILPIAGALVAVFTGFKVLGPVISGMKQLSGVFGGLTKSIKGVAGAGGAASKAGGAVSGLMKILTKAALGVAILIGLAGAIWILAQALKVFTNDVDWKGMLKAGVALVVLAGAMFGLGLLFATPIGAMAIAGAGAFAVVLLILASALWIFGKAIGVIIKALDPELIKNLAAIGSPELAEGLGLVGKAIMNFVKQFKLLQLLKAPFLIALGMAIKEFAVGLWVLGEIKNIDDATRAMGQLSGAVQGLAKGRFKRNVAEVGEAIKYLSDAMINLSKIKPEIFAGLSAGMLAATEGIEEWASIMAERAERGGLVGFFGGKRDLGQLAESLKALAIGMWVLAEAGDKLGSISTHMIAAKPALGDLFDVIAGIPMAAQYNMELFGKLGDALGNLTGLSAESVVALDSLAPIVTRLGNVFGQWDNRSIREGAKNFTNFVKDLNQAGPMKISTDIEGTGTARLEAEVGEVGTVEGAIRVVFEEQTNKLIAKLDNIFSDEWRAREEATAGALQRIVTNTGRR